MTPEILEYDTYVKLTEIANERVTKRRGGIIKLIEAHFKKINLARTNAFKKLGLNTDKMPELDRVDFDYKFEFRILAYSPDYCQIKCCWIVNDYYLDNYYYKINLADDLAKLTLKAESFAKRYAKDWPKHKYPERWITPKVITAERMKRRQIKFVNRLANRLGDAPIELLALLVEADHSGRDPLPREMPKNMKEILKLSREIGLQTKGPDRIVMGRHLIELGLKPGTYFGELLDAAYEMQLDCRFETVEDGLKLLQPLLDKVNE